MDEQKGSFLVDFVYFEFVESIQVLQVVTVLYGKTLALLLDHDDAVGSKKYQQKVVKHHQMPVLVRHCRSQFL